MASVRLFSEYQVYPVDPEAGGWGGGQRWKLQFVEFMFSPVTPTAPLPGSSPHYTDEETALSDISGMAETLFRMGMLTTKEP